VLGWLDVEAKRKREAVGARLSGRLSGAGRGGGAGVASGAPEAGAWRR
jgi:hypothetical protein